MPIATLTMNPALDITTETPELVSGHKLRCGTPILDPGGGGINVARAIHALGGSATAVFPAGGTVGERLVQLLGDAQVSISRILITGTTRESFTVDETSTGRQYRFVLPGPTLTENDYVACLNRVADITPRPRWLVTSGSLPPGVPDHFYALLGRLCRACGIALILDSSGAAFSKCDVLDAYLIKPSLKELEAAVGRSLPDEVAQIDAARTLQSRGFARSVLVSLGGNGALLVTSKSAYRFATPSVEIRSTVGAGDSMLAGVTLKLSRGDTLVEAVRFGVAAGAAALTARGTALARREEVERLVERVPAPVRLDNLRDPNGM